MAFKHSRSNRVTVHGQRILTKWLLVSTCILLGYLFDISGCEVTLFIRDVVWHDISCICKSWLSAALITKINAKHKQLQLMCQTPTA